MSKCNILDIWKLRSTLILFPCFNTDFFQQLNPDVACLKEKQTCKHVHRVLHRGYFQASKD